MGRVTRKTRGRRRGVSCGAWTDDLLLLVAMAGVLAGTYKIWQLSLDAREAANRIAKDTCSRAVVQFLDGTVAFAGFRVSSRCRRPPPAVAHLHFRLYQRWLRARAGLHRAGRSAARSRGAGGLARERLPVNIDLHTHSNCSDGSLTPPELIARAAAAGVEVLALTDHDTVAGLGEAARSAVLHGLRLVPGVEISAAWRAQAIHVLGLWIDPSGARAVRRARRSGRAPACAHAQDMRAPGKTGSAWRGTAGRRGSASRRADARSSGGRSGRGRPCRDAPTRRFANIWVPAGRPTSRPSGLRSRKWWP